MVIKKESVLSFKRFIIIRDWWYTYIICCIDRLWNVSCIGREGGWLMNKELSGGFSVFGSF